MFVSKMLTHVFAHGAKIAMVKTRQNMCKTYPSETASVSEIAENILQMYDQQDKVHLGMYRSCH